MASEASQALGRLYDHWTAEFAAHPEWTLVEFRGLLDRWGDETAEPRGVDYIETDCDGVPAMWARPKQAADDRVLLSIHGGGYLAGSMYSHRKLYGHYAKAIGCRALILDYRLAPENPYPAGLDDTLTAYRWLLDQGIAADRIALAGDSAGGALVLALQLRIREAGLPRPCASLLLSAWADLEGKVPSSETNAGRDRLVTQDVMLSNRTAYMGEGADYSIPYGSPIHADLTGFAPLYFQVGSDEMLLDDSIITSQRAQATGVEAKVDVYPGMQHVFQFMAGNAPEADQAIAAAAAWVRPKLGLAEPRAAAA